MIHTNCVQARDTRVHVIRSDSCRDWVLQISIWSGWQAVEFIKGVLSVYDLGCRWMFTCGQQAYADYLQVSNNDIDRQRIIDSSVNYGRHCRRIRDRFEVSVAGAGF